MNSIDQKLDAAVKLHKQGQAGQALQALRDSTAEPVLFSLRLADSQTLGVRFRDDRLQLVKELRIAGVSVAPAIRPNTSMP